MYEFQLLSKELLVNILITRENGEWIKPILQKSVPLTSREIGNPVDYFYLKFLRFNLLTLNMWPGKELGENATKYGVLITLANICFKFVYAIAGTVYLWKHVGTLSFYELGHSYIMVLMSFVALTRILMVSLTKKSKKVIVMYLTKMHLIFYQHVSDFAMKTHLRINYMSRGFTLWLTCLVWSGTLLFNFIPIYRNYSSGKYTGKLLHNTTFEHAIYLELPINTSTNLYGYIFLSILNCIDSFVCTAWYSWLDLLLSVMVFTIYGHYQILLHDLGSFPLPTKKIVIPISANHHTVYTEMYSEEELLIVSKKLKACVNYHRLIALFTSMMSDAFGPMLFIYYGFHQASGCILLMQVSQMTPQAWMCYGPLTFIFTQQLVQISVIFELVGSMSEKVKDAVYGIPWEHMDIKNRKIVVIFLMNVQEPIRVKALGLVGVGVTTMATIIKTSITYFMFLRSL